MLVDHWLDTGQNYEGKKLSWNREPTDPSPVVAQHGALPFFSFFDAEIISVSVGG